jgi:hypothetical protein
MDQPGLPGLPPLAYATGLPQSWIDGQWQLQVGRGAVPWGR